MADQISDKQVTELTAKILTAAGIAPPPHAVRAAVMKVAIAAQLRADKLKNSKADPILADYVTSLCDLCEIWEIQAGAPAKGADGR